MEIIHIADIISLLRIPPPKTGQSSYYVQCPCCDENPRKTHLNINLKKDVFRCPRCGVSGGIFDLYSLYTGVPRSDAYKSITERLNWGGTVNRTYVKPIVENNAVQEYPITDVATRHSTYQAFLSCLNLASDHRENLLQRGLSDCDIQRLGYKTTPILGLTSIAKRLQAEGHYLAGVPGFYKTEKGEWSFVHEYRGILIPVRDINGQIQGLQIRRDSVTKRKFRWVSSAERKDGCKAEGWTHLVGNDYTELILTEGPMKADVVNVLTGMTVLAVPGVNALTRLRQSLEELQALGLKKIKTAFDMDFSTNVHVQNGYNSLLELLNEMGFRYGTYLWDSSYKGLDDYILAHKKR